MGHLIKAGAMTASVNEAIIADCEPDRRSGKGSEAYSAAVSAAGCVPAAIWRFGSTQPGRAK